MSDSDKYPNLTTAALGLPTWAIYVRKVNTLNIYSAMTIVAYLSVFQSAATGFKYLALFAATWFLTGLIGSQLVKSGSMLATILISAVVLVSTNVLLALHFFEVWSLIDVL